MSRSRLSIIAASIAVLGLPGLGSGTHAVTPAAEASAPSTPAKSSATSLAAAPLSSTLSRRSQVALTWAPEYMSNQHSYSQAEAVGLARQFDLVAAMPASFAKYASAMRSANPNLHLLTYSNAMFSGPTTASGLPESAFAHTKSGARIKSIAFGSKLMEPSSVNWRNRAVSGCQSRVAQSNYDGCLLDMLTMGIYSKNYVTALPAKPGAGRDYTQTEWRSGLITVEQAFQSQLPNLVIVGNMVSNAYRFWRAPVTSQPIVAASQGSQMEDFLRAATDPVGKFPTPSEWLDNVNTIKRIESMGLAGLYSTKLWSGATAAEVKRWDAYAMASFLTQANGHSYFAFTPARSQAGATGLLNPYTMPTTLGIPTGTMGFDHQLYKRTFANGLVLVNAGATTITVPLTTQGRDLDAVTRTRVSLAPHSGTVLVRAGPGVLGLA